MGIHPSSRRAIAERVEVQHRAHVVDTIYSSESRQTVLRKKKKEAGQEGTGSGAA